MEFDAHIPETTEMIIALRCSLAKDVMIKVDCCWQQVKATSGKISMGHCVEKMGVDLGDNNNGPLCYSHMYTDKLAYLLGEDSRQ